MKKRFPGGWLVAISIAVLLVLVFRPGRLASAYRLNLLALNWADLIENPRPDLDRSRNRGDCRTLWYAGFWDRAAGNSTPETSAWSDAIRCEADLIPYLNAIEPDSLAWAQFAVEAQPGNAGAWFWLGDLQEVNLVEYYRTALRIDPSDARRWLVLGDHLVQSDPESALLAYHEACYRGDPGYQGCSRAGDTARDLGDIDSAIEYYLRSDWPAVRNKANQLSPAP